MGGGSDEKVFAVSRLRALKKINFKEQVGCVNAVADQVSWEMCFREIVFAVRESFGQV